MSSTNNIGSISGNEDYFHQVCHTDKEHQYNVVQISNE